MKEKLHRGFRGFVFKVSNPRMTLVHFALWMWGKPVIYKVEFTNVTLEINESSHGLILENMFTYTGDGRAASAEF